MFFKRTPPPPMLNKQKISVNKLIDLIAKTFSKSLKEDKSFVNQNLSFDDIPFANNMYDFIRHIFSESLPQNKVKYPESVQITEMLMWYDEHSLKIDGVKWFSDDFEINYDDNLIDLDRNRYLYIPNWDGYGLKENDVIFFPEGTKSRHFGKIYRSEDIQIEKEVSVIENHPPRWFLHSYYRSLLKNYEGSNGFGTNIDFIANNYDYFSEVLEMADHYMCELMALKNIYNNETLPLFKSLFYKELHEINGDDTLLLNTNKIYNLFHNQEDVISKSHYFNFTDGICLDLKEEKLYFINPIGQLVEPNSEAVDLDFFDHINLSFYVKLFSPPASLFNPPGLLV